MPIVPPNLDDRSADELFAELRARIPVHTPEWTNLTDADPGITILQLFSFLTDNLLYRSNRIPEASRLRFLSLLGIGLEPASPGVGFVTFESTMASVVPARTVVRAGSVPFTTRRAVNLTPVEGHVFYKRRRDDLDEDTLAHLRRLHEPFLDDTATGLEFYDPILLDPPTTGAPLPDIDLASATSGAVDGSIWVALACTKAAVRLAGDAESAVAAARVALAGTTLSLGVHPADRPEGAALAPRRAIVETDDPGLVVEAPAPGASPSYQQLVVSYAENVLDVPGVLDVVLPPLDRFVTPWELDPTDEGSGDHPPLVHDRELATRIVTWVRLRHRGVRPQVGDSRHTSSAIAWVGINAVRVVQAVEVVGEPLGIGTGAPDQRLRLANTPVMLGEPGIPPTVEVQDDRGSWTRWRRTDDLLSAGAEDPVYELDAESGVVSFGDGIHGARPPRQSRLRASYEYGGGPAGIVAIDGIKSADSLPGVKVRNPLATWGAAAGESVAEAERSIPRWLRHRDRLVTASDFRDVTMRTPGVDIARVDVLPLFDPKAGSVASQAPGVVTVMVVPRADGEAANPPDATDQHVIDSVCAWLDERRLITTEVYVRGPRWVRIWVSIGVALVPGELREVVEQRVRAAVTDYLSPLTGGLTATGGLTLEETGASPAGWPLGASVRTDDLFAAATRVPGVRHVEGVRMAARRAGGTVVSDVREIGLDGLELPAATVFVRAGAPDDPSTLLGGSSSASALVAVPVIPRRC